jgi:hypothetical protein
MDNGPCHDGNDTLSITEGPDSRQIVPSHGTMQRGMRREYASGAAAHGAVLVAQIAESGGSGETDVNSRLPHPVGRRGVEPAGGSLRSVLLQEGIGSCRDATERKIMMLWRHWSGRIEAYWAL